MCEFYVSLKDMKIFAKVIQEEENGYEQLRDKRRGTQNLNIKGSFMKQDPDVSYLQVPSLDTI